MNPNTIEQIAEKYEDKLSHCDFHMWVMITTTGRTLVGEMIFQAITESTAAKDAKIHELRIRCLAAEGHASGLASDFSESQRQHALVAKHLNIKDWSHTIDFVGPIKALNAEIAELKKDSRRWKYYASSPQTALMLGSRKDPNDNTIDWVKVCEELADSAMKG